MNPRWLFKDVFYFEKTEEFSEEAQQRLRHTNGVKSIRVGRSSSGIYFVEVYLCQGVDESNRSQTQQRLIARVG